MLPKASIKGKTLRKKKEAVCSNIIKQQKGFDSITAKASFCYQKIYKSYVLFLAKESLKSCDNKRTYHYYSYPYQESTKTSSSVFVFLAYLC